MFRYRWGFNPHLNESHQIKMRGGGLKPQGFPLVETLGFGQSEKGFSRMPSARMPSAFLVKFQVMEPQERQSIANNLKSLEAEQKAKGANTEAIALAKTNYFIQREL
ncbi:hypothetical protein WA1_06430 [Scytonema hofmannii PCC 7110]|uniref:Uncharacterized protein n=1 Tax=Scytonema hofmannii PCC 7110 TaxID=128403 RepID=A0A139WSP9_9CYAN|nr:hypothetical protein [Scytonema hofmannii]KYC35458.1 hypothetical protein WA1_06430 [Scytonema hofmannii PCC 7110]